MYTRGLQGKPDSAWSHVYPSQGGRCNILRGQHDRVPHQISEIAKMARLRIFSVQIASASAD